MNFLNIIKQIWDNREFIIGGLFILFLILFLRQCNETKKVEDKLANTQHIANQNLAALNDKEIQLRVTKEQLKQIDGELYNSLNKIDSISKIKSKVITVTKPIYLGKDVITPSNLVFDSINRQYGLKFKSVDMVRTINGTSWFKIDNNDKSISIKPINTKLNDFKLNFALVISQYDDSLTKYTKTKIIPFNVDSNGSVGEQIPESLLKVDFRNAEILDKPFTPNKPSEPPTKPKRFETGFALTFTPLALGIYQHQTGVNFGYTPNIGISYYITLKKK